MNQSNQPHQSEEIPQNNINPTGQLTTPSIEANESKISKNSQNCAENHSESNVLGANRVEETKTEPEETKVGTRRGQEESIDPAHYYESRCKIIQNLKEDLERYPYPHKFDVTHTVRAFHEEFAPICTENHVFNETRTVSLAGN